MPHFGRTERRSGRFEMPLAESRGYQRDVLELNLKELIEPKILPVI